MTSRTKTGDLRILGASDGYAHALISLRSGWIAPLAGHYVPSFHPKHVRKIAARDAKLKPLREIEQWLMTRHAEAKKAYEKTCSDGEQQMRAEISALTASLARAREERDRRDGDIEQLKRELRGALQDASNRAGEIADLRRERDRLRAAYHDVREAWGNVSFAVWERGMRTAMAKMSGVVLDEQPDAGNEVSALIPVADEQEADTENYQGDNRYTK